METINIHPIFVHFPIALLTLYAIFEIVRLPVLMRQQWWFPVKAAFLFMGFLGGLASFQTGEWAEGAYRETSTMNLVELHSTFAEVTLWVYGVLAAVYLIEWLHRGNVPSRLPDGLQKIWGVLRAIERALFQAPFLILGSVAGLVLITITGALGGAITYGPDIDPVVSIIYHVFFP